MLSLSRSIRKALVIVAVAKISNNILKSYAAGVCEPSLVSSIH
jgi:hypothetical protein